MRLAGPRVEIAYNTDSARVRRPHRKARAPDPVDFVEVRTELAINVVVIAFAEEMKIEIGNRQGLWVAVCGCGETTKETPFPVPLWPQSTACRLPPNDQITGLMPQMLSAYSRILRSLENGPMLSALMMA